MPSPTSAPTSTRAGGSPLRARRALSAGLVAGAGAFVAHGLAGGFSGAAHGGILLLLAGLVSATGVAVAAPLTRVRLDLSGLLATALVTQIVFHVALMLAVPTAPMGHDAAMIAAHGAAAALTVLVATGVERAWWRLADALEVLLDWLRIPAPVTLRLAIARTTAAMPRLGVRARIRSRGAVAPRGPPRSPASRPSPLVPA